MHFVTGGAYNGKAKWVKNHYTLDMDHVQWISAYRTSRFHFIFMKTRLCRKGLKLGLKGDASEQEAAVIRLNWQEIIERDGEYGKKRRMIAV